MASFSLFCTPGRAEEIANQLRDEGHYVEVSETIQGRTRFEVDCAPVGDEMEEMTEIRAYRAIVSVLEDYASDR